MKKATMNKIMKIVTVLAIIAMIATMLSSVFAEGATDNWNRSSNLLCSSNNHGNNFRCSIYNSITRRKSYN